MRGRAIAALAAVAMIVGAVVIRDQVIEGGGESGSGDRDGGASLVCARELPDAVCGAEETLDATFARLLAAPADQEATWVTPGRWPLILDEARRAMSKPALFERTTTLASTKLVIVTRGGLSCNGSFTWKCVGDALQSDASRIAGPARGTSARLHLRAALVGGYLGTSDFASNDVRDDPALLDWLAGAERGIDRSRSFGATSLRDFLAKQGSADVYVSTEAEANGLASTTVEVATPSPTVKLDVVAGSTGRLDTDGLRATLLEQGWEPPPQEEEEDGLPSPGVLLALREVVS